LYAYLDTNKDYAITGLEFLYIKDSMIYDSQYIPAGLESWTLTYHEEAKKIEAENLKENGYLITDY